MLDFTYTSSSLTPTNKAGRIKPDNLGYYTIVGGALNVHNSAGDYYPANGALDVFESSSTFMKSINERAVYSENGHPDVSKYPPEEEEKIVERLLSMDQDKLTNHIGSVELDYDLAKKHPNVLPHGAIAIMLRVKPYGPLKHMCEDAMKNPVQNLCYSSRTFTHHKTIDGVVHKIIRHIVTFDLVVLPGISSAMKRYSPTVETRQVMCFDDPVKLLSEMKEKREKTPSGYSQESSSVINTAYQGIVGVSGKPLSSQWS